MEMGPASFFVVALLLTICAPLTFLLKYRGTSINIVLGLTSGSTASFDQTPFDACQ